MIRGITFDLWDTVIHDDSDEPKRARDGLEPKRDARRRLACEAAGVRSPQARAEVTEAFDLVEAEFNQAWHADYVTWTVAQRIDRLESLLDVEIEDGPRAALLDALERMELDVAPDPVPGMIDAVRDLATRYRLAVVSDAIYSPGRCLREWLARNGILECFDAFAFSDEVGWSKPRREMFDTAAAGLGLAPETLVHVGDRQPKDVAGAQALGMRAVLFAVTRDADVEDNSADAVCRDASELPAIVDALAASTTPEAPA